MNSILYVHGNSDMIGGIETFLYDSLFHHKRFTPHVLFIKNGELPARLAERGFSRLTILNGGRLRYPHKTLAAVTAICSYIKKQEIDVVLAHGHHAWIYAGLAARLSGVKSVFFAHQIMDPADNSLRHPIEFIGGHITPSLVLANSDATRCSVETIWGKSCLKPRYGIDLTRFSNSKTSADLRSALGIPKDSFVVTTIGRIQEWKGQEYFVRAVPLILQEFPNACFLIVGSPTFEKDFEYFNHLKKLANDHSIERRVLFLGFRKDIPDILAASDILVHTSIQAEPFGLVVLEGMAAGKPVIATNAGGPAEIIRDGVEGFLIPPADANALSATVIRLLKDADLRSEIGKKAQSRTRDFSIESCMQDIERILEELISK